MSLVTARDSSVVAFSDIVSVIVSDIFQTCLLNVSDMFSDICFDILSGHPSEMCSGMFSDICV